MFNQVKKCLTPKLNYFYYILRLYLFLFYNLDLKLSSPFSEIVYQFHTQYLTSEPMYRLFKSLEKFGTNTLIHEY